MKRLDFATLDVLVLVFYLILLVAVALSSGCANAPTLHWDVPRTQALSTLTRTWTVEIELTSDTQKIRSITIDLGENGTPAYPLGEFNKTARVLSSDTATSLCVRTDWTKNAAAGFSTSMWDAVKVALGYLIGSSTLP